MIFLFLKFFKENLKKKEKRKKHPSRCWHAPVVESVHQAVITEKDQPFTFDAQHKVTCKGFGSVPAQGPRQSAAIARNLHRNSWAVAGHTFS